MNSELSHVQLDDVVVPALLRRLAGDRPVQPVWRNEIGQVTYVIGDGAEYVKHGRAHPEFDPVGEAERLCWVSEYVSCPRPIDHGTDGADLWLRTAGVPGTSAVFGQWPRYPEQVVPELGRALRRFHDRIPASECPWDWSVERRLTYQAIDRSQLGEQPSLDLVICHGDACNPNFLLDSAGRCVGYVDLGRLGVADRWADLAPALLSLGWNFGPDWEGAFLDGYGIAPDPAKLEFYTRLWQAE
ncbi:MAG: aminoglycoside 3'-phosphotransferase [Propionibacteriaceae bacterium]|nr:aminoglycoside 3'-phosphotransferase [Propionibacteriaceae bacterium]